MWRDMGRPASVLEAVNDAARVYFTAALPSGGYVGWLAEADGKIVGGGGVVISEWPGNPGSTLAKRAMILNMFVEPEYRRRGIARALMVAMIDWCKAQGFPSVGLHASDEGRPLYESLGFGPTNEMRLTL
ncbi:GCN5-related N-acetyltransferase [Candidatus Koribacter versatilis Ellin345]|uniref:GCN5-related N-acetyltransferase n=2 Tax=Candidatus Korobacter versatilis TaxID=658062 RepID=Q1IKP8_KORVE|nr:GCN5-related N-acetyltransferase [Candidatus Koribacter versatilis Ellin345]